MKIEHDVKVFPVDETLNEAVAKMSAEGWAMLPGVKPIGIFPVVRTTLEESEKPTQLAPAPAPLMTNGGELHMPIGDDEVYILRGGQLIDSQGNVVTEEERQRRWQIAEKKRQEYAARRAAENAA